MITYEKLPDGSVYVTQASKAITVYLDLWFWSALAKSQELRERFVSAAAGGCTIMYSIYTMIELATIRHPEQVQAIRDVMDSVDFGFAENDPNTVIKLEDAHETEAGSGVFSGLHPATDREMLGHLVKSVYPNADLQMSNIYSELQSEAHQRFKKMGVPLATTMNRRIRDARKSSDYMAKVKARRRKKAGERHSPPYTRDVLQRFLDYVIVTKNIRMTKNDWLDMMHLIVPLSYCSIVLADGRWLHFAQCELKLPASSLAQLYGPRQKEEFLLALESEGAL